MTKTRRSTAPGVLESEGWLPGRPWGAPPLAFTAMSAADRVPDRLHLKEGGDPFGALGCGVIEPVEPGFGDPCRAAREALDVIGGEELDLGAHVVRDPPRVERVDVGVA